MSLGFIIGWKVCFFSRLEFFFWEFARSDVDLYFLRCVESASDVKDGGIRPVSQLFSRSMEQQVWFFVSACFRKLF